MCWGGMDTRDLEGDFVPYPVLLGVLVGIKKKKKKPVHIVKLWVLSP